MRKHGFYNEDSAPKADTTTGYGIYDHSGLNPGKVSLPATNEEASTASAVGRKKKRKKVTDTMEKKSSEGLSRGFAEEMQKLGFGMMGGMGGGGGLASVGAAPMMGHGGVVTSKSKKGLGPKIKIVSSSSKKKY